MIESGWIWNLIRDRFDIILVEPSTGKVRIEYSATQPQGDE